jgi:hypothetical protein
VTYYLNVRYNLSVLDYELIEDHTGVLDPLVSGHEADATGPDWSEYISFSPFMPGTR